VKVVKRGVLLCHCADHGDITNQVWGRNNVFDAVYSNRNTANKINKSQQNMTQGNE